MISVLLADDHGFTLAGMRAALESNGKFDVVGMAETALEAISLGKTLRPDLAVLDFDMPDATGLEAFLELRRWSPATRIAIVTGISAPETLSQLAASGVDGLFTKGSSPNAICDGLSRVAAGERVLPQGFGDDTGPVLSAREVEVLLAISRGLSNKQVGETLAISPKTVESHRASLMRKLGVHTTAELVVAAVRQGYLKV